MTKQLIAVLVAVMVFFSLGGCGSNADSSSSSSSASPQTVEAPKAKETVFGTGSRIISKSGSGQMIGMSAVFHADSSLCTEENVATWYEEYVRYSAEDWCVVVYDDDPTHGVYATNDGIVEINVGLEKQYDGTYMEADDSEASFYMYDKKTKTLNPWS